ncbi:uncharacterized protein LOC124162898 isoform X2 [Ischnura elegans]|uniref:uncharacterized protein LOC124162898 isoform X2 n=1 Tax=Ischnura elegans TaxID=197161 RepID=UPI001ED8BA8F|nr:uncharacterized protein LOC124162898 isoform X2 [Ischnura elegans]
MSKEVADEYSSSLADLTVNSKPLINMLTILAEENIDHAPAIVQAVEKHLAKVMPEIKLPVLYLIDSIVKNVGRAYVSLFTQNIVSTFCSVFEKVDERTRSQMFKLRQTWNEVFPLKKLYAVDVRVNSMDPAWPITAPTPTASIHLNPRFLSMAPNSVSSIPPAPSGTPQPSTSASSSIAVEPGTGTEAQQALTEAQMREQLLRKQKELLELQQRKLELELLQTKAKLEDQQRQLQVKEQQRQVEQVEDDTSKVISLKTEVKKKVEASSRSAVQVPIAEEFEKTSKLNLDPKSARDPRLNRQPVSEIASSLFSGSNMLPQNVISEIAKSKLANKNPVVSTLNKGPRLGTKDPRLNKLPPDISTHLEVPTSIVNTTSSGINPQSTLSSMQNVVSTEVKRKPNFLPISSSSAKSQYPQQRTVSPLKVKKGTNGQVISKGKHFNVAEEGPGKNIKAFETVSKGIKDEKFTVGRKGTDAKNETSPRKSNSSEPSSHPSSPIKSDNHRSRSEHGRKVLGKSHDVLMEKKEGRKKDNLFKTSSSKSPPASAKGSPDSKRKRDRKKDGPGQRLSPRKSPSLSSAPTDKGSSGPRDGESENHTFKGLKNSRSRNYIRRNQQESSRSPSPCEFTPTPLPNSSLKQSSDSSSSSVLGPKAMGDVDLRQCPNPLGVPAEKIPRLAVYADGLPLKDVKDEEIKKSLPPSENLRGSHEDRSKKSSGEGDIINKDVDLRHMSRSPPHAKKRQSLEKSDPPPTKKSKAEMFDVLFGNEDVDLRQLPTLSNVAAPLQATVSAPVPDPAVSCAPPTSTMSSPSKRDSVVPPPPLPPLPLTLAVPAPTVNAIEDAEMVPLDEKTKKKNPDIDDMVADRAKLWAKYKEVNPDTYKSPLKPSWKAYEGENADPNKHADVGIRSSSPRLPGRGVFTGALRGGFGRSNRAGSFRRLPDMRSSGSPSRRLPGLEDDDDKVRPAVRDDDDEDTMAGPGADLGANPSSLNISIIVAQADEQLKNGTMSITQYNTLLKQVIHLNEIQKLREAQRREDEHERGWGSGGESPIEQWDLMDRGKRDEELSKRRDGDKEEDARGRVPGKDRRPGMETEVPLLGRNFPPPHDKPLLGMHGDIDERIQPPVGALVGGLGPPPMDKGGMRPNILPDVSHQPPHMHPNLGPGGGPPGGTPPWSQEGQPPMHMNRRWEGPGPVGGPGQWGHHPGHGAPFPPSGGVGPKTPGDLLPIRRDFSAPSNAGGFVGPGPRWTHPPPMTGPPFRDEGGVFHHGPERFPGPPMPNHPGQNRFRLRELPPPDRAELAAAESDRMKTINIDGVPREIRFYGDTAIIMMGWDDPRDLCFQGGSRRVSFDGGSESIICSFGETPREIMVSGRSHLVRLGAPTRELNIDGRWYECHFGGPPMPVDLDDNRRHFVELAGPPPQVRIGTERRTDLVAGKINLIIDARDMVPIFLDAKPQCFEIEGRPHTLRFTHALRYVVINGRQFRVEFGGLPMPIIVHDRKHFIRFSVLPRGIMPGYVSIAGMEGGRLPSPLPPPPQGPPLVQGNVPIDEGPRPIAEEIPQDHRRVPFEPVISEPEEITKSVAPAHKFTGHEPAMPMIGSGSRGRMQHGGRRPFDEHLRHTRRPSPSRTNLPPHLRHGNNEGGAAFVAQQGPQRGAAANASQGPQLPLELLTSLMPVTVAPASGFSYQVQQDSSSDTTKKDSESSTSEAVSEAPAVLSKTLPGLGGLDINVEALFQRLVATGILPQADNPAAEGNKKEDNKSNFKADFSSECLKSRHPGVISAIYTGIQCSSCGVRFPPEQTMKYSQHLDWHFRQNRRDRDSARKAQSRKWYYDVSDWIQFEEMEDLEERAQSWFESQGVAESKDDRAGTGTGNTAAGSGNGAGTNNDEATVLSVPAGEKAEDQHCAVCREGFEQFYNEEKEEWHLKDAVRFEENTYHPVCYEDYKASLEASVEESAEGAENVEEGNEDSEKKEGCEEESAEVKNEEECATKEASEVENKVIKEEPTEDGNTEDAETAEVEELLKHVKVEPKDDSEKDEAEMETEASGVAVKEEPGVSSEEVAPEVKEEPMESEEIEEKQDEEMEEIVEPVAGTVDTTLNVVACSIDGNVEFEDTASVGAPVPGRIKINISKPLVSNPPQSTGGSSESEELAPPGVDDVEANKECSEEGVVGETESETKEELVDEEAQVAPPPPGEGTLRLKPRLIGRKLTELPPVMKGTELSGLCSIM